MPKLTVEQAAELRGVTPRTVRRWCESGALRAARFGKSWMVDQEDLKTFVPRKRGRRPKQKEER